MRKRQFELSQVQINELQWAYQQCKDGATKIRYQAVRLYGTGYGVEEIQTITGCSRPSLLAWCRDYRQYGIAGLVDKRSGGNRAKLSAFEREELERQLHSYTPQQLFGRAVGQGDGQFWTVADLAQLLERDYGVTYQSVTSYRTLLKRCGLSRQRPGKEYKSRSAAKVMAFEEALEKNSSTRPRRNLTL